MAFPKRIADIEINMTLAELHVAIESLREEPYERLPYLAGALAFAAQRIELMRDDIKSMEHAIERVQCRWPFCSNAASGNAGSNGPMCREHICKAFQCVEHGIKYCECGSRMDCCKCSNPKTMKLSW